MTTTPKPTSNHNPSITCDHNNSPSQISQSNSANIAQNSDIAFTASDDTECIANPSPKKQQGKSNFKNNVFGAFNRIQKDGFSVPNAGKFAGLSLQKIKGEFEKAANEVLNKTPPNLYASPHRNDRDREDSFRGRYVMSPEKNGGRIAVTSISSPINSPSTQVSKILQSREGAHVESVMRSVLKSKNEYMILLGPGPLGAYLKDIYKPTGTGAIGKSGGSLGVYVDYIIPRKAAEKSGLVDVGDRIIKVGDNDVTGESILTIPQMIANSPRPLVIVMSRAHVPSNPPSAIDIAIEDVFRVQDEAARLANEKSLSSMPLIDSYSSSCSSSDEQEINVVSSSLSDDSNACDESTRSEYNNLVHLNGFQRRSEKRSFTALSRAVARDPGFRDILRKAFIECCIDPRRLPFITSYVAGEDEAMMKMESETDSLQKQTISESIKLMFWLEVQSFKDLWNLTPIERSRGQAKRIFEKFLNNNTLQHKNSETSLPDIITDENSNTLTPDMFNLRSRFSHSDLLRRVEDEIKDYSNPLSIDVLSECQKLIENDLCGARFASFLDSDEGARMRAYLMAATPIVDLPIKDIFNAAVTDDTNALSFLNYMLIHLIGEGVPGGLSAAYYIKKRLLPLLSQEQWTKTKDLYKGLTEFWKSFLCPVYGSLDKLLHSSYCENTILNARAAVLSACSNFKDDCNLVNESSDLMSIMITLADELLFDYVTNFGPKFKQDQIYAHMCEEVADYRSKQKEPLHNSGLSILSKSCVSRLLRKCGVPSSVSMHRPLYSSPKIDTHSFSTESIENRSDHPTTAEYAIVFGSDEVIDEDNEDTSVSSVPPHKSVKCFCTSPITECKSSLLDTMGIPLSIEKYAFVPPKRRSPFVDPSNEKR